MRFVILSLLICCTSATAQERANLDQLINAVIEKIYQDRAIARDAYIYQEQNARPSVQYVPAPSAVAPAFRLERNYFLDAVNQEQREYRLEKERLGY